MDLPSAVAVVIVPAAVLNTIFMIPVYLLVRALDRWLNATWADRMRAGSGWWS